VRSHSRPTIKVNNPNHDLRSNTMWKKIAIAGSVAAAIVGTGAGALAATSSSSTPTPTTSSSTTAKAPSTTGKTAAKGKARAALALRKIEHGEWVTRDKSGADVTHDAVGGTVTAVSASSITVKATDGFSETFAVGSSTKVHVKGAKPATIANVKVSDRAVVAGTKSGSTVTATQVLDAGTK
jgi:hypothetical protein